MPRASSRASPRRRSGRQRPSDPTGAPASTPGTLFLSVRLLRRHFPQRNDELFDEHYAAAAHPGPDRHRGSELRHWTVAQMVTHPTCNGCNLRSGQPARHGHDLPAQPRTASAVCWSSPRAGGSRSSYPPVKRVGSWKTAMRSCCELAPAVAAPHRSALASAGHKVAAQPGASADWPRSIPWKPDKRRCCGGRRFR